MRMNRRTDMTEVYSRFFKRGYRALKCSEVRICLAWCSVFSGLLADLRVESASR